MGIDYTKNFSKVSCPYDLEIMDCIQTRYVVSRNNVHKKILMPIYHCSTCNRLFTVILKYPDMSILTLDGNKIINIRDDEVHKSLRPPKKFSPYEKDMAKKGKPFTGAIRADYKKKDAFLYADKCPRRCLYGHYKDKLQDIDIVCLDGTRHLKRCIECGLFYVGIEMYEDLKPFFTFRNEDEVKRLKSEKIEAEKRNEEQKSSKYKKTYSNEKSASSGTDRIVIPSKENDPYRKNYFMYPPIDGSNLKKTGSSWDTDAMYRKKDAGADVELTARDFLVRRSTFKCRHDNHKLQNVTAEIQLVNQNGVLVSKTFTAGFCPECKVYFIMDSVFQSLRKYGILMCRIQNEKAYLNNNTRNGNMDLAEESILMQYGYNVSQTEGLTTLQRRKILSILVDLKILTKNDIISYLDFFINIRGSNPVFERAVAKWEEDREYIDEYRTGDYQKIGVAGIRKKY